MRRRVAYDGLVRRVWQCHHQDTYTHTYIYTNFLPHQQSSEASILLLLLRRPSSSVVATAATVIAVRVLRRRSTKRCTPAAKPTRIAMPPPASTPTMLVGRARESLPPDTPLHTRHRRFVLVSSPMDAVEKAAIVARLRVVIDDVRFGLLMSHDSMSIHVSSGQWPTPTAVTSCTCTPASQCSYRRARAAPSLAPQRRCAATTEGGVATGPASTGIAAQPWSAAQFCTAGPALHPYGMSLSLVPCTWTTPTGSLGVHRRDMSSPCAHVCCIEMWDNWTSDGLMSVSGSADAKNCICPYARGNEPCRILRIW